MENFSDRRYQFKTGTPSSNSFSNYSLKAVKLPKAEAFRSCITEIVRRGGDSDTNGIRPLFYIFNISASVAGALLGAFLGNKFIPEDWSEQLTHKKWLTRKVGTLLDVLASNNWRMPISE